MTASAAQALFRHPSALTEVSPGFFSALPQSAAPYDRKAALYDAIVGRPLYHRVWGTSPARYSEFGRDARTAAGSEPFAEIGCGSLLFTARMYHERTPGPIVISDRSLVMLRRAMRRLPQSSVRPVILHADAASLPLESHAFASILVLNLLHVPCDRAAIIAECGRLLVPGRGRLFATCLIRTGRWSDAAVSFFHRTGELGPPLTRDEAAELLSTWGDIESFNVDGNMAFIVVRHSG